MNPYKDIPSSAIVTYTGRFIEPLNPNPADIDIIDIAHSLAHQCRFTGHTHAFYSVAQHSVLVSQHCAPEDALWGLLHDASEAYLADMARPIKRYTDWGKEYVEAEDALMTAVGDAFDLPQMSSEDYGLSLPASVKTADDLLIRTEMRDLMPDGMSEAWPGDTLEDEIICWTPEQAKHWFMERYRELTSDN